MGFNSMLVNSVELEGWPLVWLVCVFGRLMPLVVSQLARSVVPSAGPWGPLVPRPPVPLGGG